MRNDPLRAAWIAAVIGLGLSALRVLDILLLKRFLDRPFVVAAWVIAIFVWLLLARLTARRMVENQRSRLQRWAAELDGPALVLAGFYLLLLFGAHWGYQRAASDGREYYVQVRSLVMDWDLDFANENATFGVRGTASIYAFGATVLWIPFFLLAHLWLGLLNLLGAEYVRDGFFNPYQRAVGLGSLIYGCIGLTLLFRLTSAYFSRWLAAIATIAVCTGSFLLWYFVVDPSLPHAVSMASVALFVYLWHRDRDDRDLQQWAWLGLAGGVMSMVRWQNVAFAILPAADALHQLWEARRTSNSETIVPLLWRHLAFAATFLVGFAPQMVFWKVTRGGWLDMPTGAHAVTWTGPIRDVLFTPDHGLFTWTPVLLLAMLGFVGFAWRDRWMGSLLLIAFFAQVYVLGTVESPGYGFGTRRMANCTVLFVLGLAMLLAWLREHPIVAPAAAVASLMIWNLVFIANVRGSRLAPTGAVRSGEIVAAFVERVGNPLSAPMNLWFAWKYDTDLEHYERLGTQTFNNLRLDIGGNNDDRFLSGGWSGREGDDETFRWSEGPESAFLAPLKERADYTIALRAAPFEHPDGHRQTIDVELNGELLERVVLARGMNDYAVPAPADRVRAGVNQIRLRYAWTVSPRSLGLSDDTRSLAVRFDRVDLLRR